MTDQGQVLLSISKHSKAFDEGNKPQRGIFLVQLLAKRKVFCHSSIQKPYFPSFKNYSELNIDMVGRQDTIQQDNNHIYLTGSDRISKELPQ